ncbi:MAG TPA: ABC transporter substrate-binding protein, partial [Candidatus Omnitrophota bacterium]|nr:ABC transporter substrate-binding protein [Candidatus Omnitrophota bacterium]
MIRAALATIFCIALNAAVATTSLAKELNVVFLNPGAAQDIGLWGVAANFMRAAADDLDINLEILFADRDHYRMQDQANAVAARPVQPDYVIMVNERQRGPAMLRAFQDSSAKIVFLHNGLTGEQRAELGNEREAIPNWIATIVQNERRAGYLLMQELASLHKGPAKVLAISGEQATPVSTIREQGLRDYIARSGKGRIQVLQSVNGNWGRPDGREKTRGLLTRYDDVDIIWAANDSMALGA